MIRTRRLVLWVVMAAIAVLTVLSIVATFLGAARAKALFSSVPLVAFWFLLVGLLISGAEKQ